MIHHITFRSLITIVITITAVYTGCYMVKSKLYKQSIYSIRGNIR